MDYEDPLYTQADLHVVVAPRWELLHPGSREYSLNGGSFEFTYRENDGDPLLNQKNALQALVSAYNATVGATKFSTTFEGSARFAIVPVSGSPLDVQISPPPGTKTFANAMEAVLSCASAASGAKIVLLNYPIKGVEGLSVTPLLGPHSARVVLLDFLAHCPYPLVWQLLYDPNLKEYHLNLLPVTQSFTSLDGSVHQHSIVN